MHWQPNENLINYYKQKLVQIEVSVLFKIFSVFVYLLIYIFLYFY